MGKGTDRDPPEIFQRVSERVAELEKQHARTLSSIAARSPSRIPRATENGGQQEAELGAS